MFTYAIITAVSSAEQATLDKASLDSQYQNARSYGDRAGGTFVKEYRVDGYSRADYYDLTQAFIDIPVLGELSRDAQARKFDVVLVDSMDRLGDLAFAMLNYLKLLRIQLRSVQQPIPIEDPTIYDPRRDDATTMMIASSMTIQNYRISKIVRAFAVGNPARAKAGKYGTQVPFGYRKVDKETVEIDETTAPLVRDLAEWLLSGKTIGEVVNLANQSGIKPPRVEKWTHNIIVYMLRNPFYSGKTFYGRSEKVKKGYYRSKRQFDLYDGKHEPIWTWETFLQIQAELDRLKRTRRTPRDYNFTGLLKCSVCGEALHISYSTTRPYKNWSCDNKHVRLRDHVANKLVADEMRRLFADEEYTPRAVENAHNRAGREMAALNRQYTKLEQAYYAGAYSAVEFTEKKKEIERRQAELKNEELQQEEARRRAAESVQMYNTMRAILPRVDIWIAERNPRQVNFYIARSMSLTVYPDKTIRGELTLDT